MLGNRSGLHEQSMRQSLLLNKARLQQTSIGGEIFGHVNQQKAAILLSSISGKLAALSLRHS